MLNPSNLIKQQYQAILRWLLNYGGASLVAAGYLTSNQLSSSIDTVMLIVGGVVSLGQLAWSVHSNQAKVIVDTANKLQQGN